MAAPRYFVEESLQALVRWVGVSYLAWSSSNCSAVAVAHAAVAAAVVAAVAAAAVAAAVVAGPY